MCFWMERIEERFEITEKYVCDINCSIVVIRNPWNLSFWIEIWHNTWRRRYFTYFFCNTSCSQKLVYSRKLRNERRNMKCDVFCSLWSFMHSRTSTILVEVFESLRCPLVLGLSSGRLPEYFFVVLYAFSVSIPAACPARRILLNFSIADTKWPAYVAVFLFV
jgi:hypothetical protein